MEHPQMEWIIYADKNGKQVYAGFIDQACHRFGLNKAWLIKELNTIGCTMLTITTKTNGTYELCGRLYED